MQFESTLRNFWLNAPYRLVSVLPNNTMVLFGRYVQNKELVFG